MAGLRLREQTTSAGGRVVTGLLVLPQLDVILVAAICVVGLAVRLHGISEPSIWLDEAVSWTQARLDFVDMIRATAQDTYPPLHNIVLYYAIRIFGDSEAALRLPSAIFGTLNILAIYWLGRSLGYRAAGALAATLLAFSGFHIWYSQEARPYALLALCATLFVTTVLLALRTGKVSWYVASAIAALALLYTHPYGILLWVSIGVVVTVYAAISFETARLRCLKLIAWQLLPGMGFMPWAIILFGRHQAIAKKVSWIPYPTFRFAYRLIFQVANGELMLGIMPAVLAALFWSSSRTEIRPSSLQSGDFSAQDRAILSAWLIGPFALGLVVSLIFQPVLWPRYLILSLPAGIILAAIGFGHLMMGRTLTAATCILVTLYAIFSMFMQPQQVRADWRGVAAYISKSFQSDDCIAMYESYQRQPFTYYFRDPIACFVGADKISDIEPADIRSSRVWLVLEGVNRLSQDVQDITGRFARQGWRGSLVQKRGIVVFVLNR